MVNHVKSISDEQLKRFTDGLAGDESFANGNGNNRDTQPLGIDRVVYYSGAGAI